MRVRLPSGQLNYWYENSRTNKTRVRREEVQSNRDAYRQRHYIPSKNPDQLTGREIELLQGLKHTL